MNIYDINDVPADLREFFEPVPQIGLEETLGEYLARLVAVFDEVRRVLRSDGVAWVNMGDSYNAAGRVGHGTRVGAKQGTNRASAAGHDKSRPSVASLKPKDLIGQPWRLAFALQEAGWYLRQDIIWSKPNPMPESIKDRCTKAHEYLFMLTKSERYWSDFDAIKERAVATRMSEMDGGAQRNMHGANVNKGRFFAGQDGELFRNRRSVWEVTTEPFSEAHFATYPTALIRPCVLATCPPSGTVLDPFTGSGTTGVVALELARNFVGIELNPEYVEIAQRRLSKVTLGLPFDAPAEAA